MTICTDSWAIYRGLTLWLPHWQQDDGQVAQKPLWGQGLWKDIYEQSLGKVVTLYHVNEHQPLRSPGKAEADDLAHIHWLEEAPAEDMAEWLPLKIHREVQKTLWEGVEAWASCSVTLV